MAGLQGVKATAEDRIGQDKASILSGNAYMIGKISIKTQVVVSDMPIWGTDPF